MADITDESIDNAIDFIESGDGEKYPGLQSDWVLEALLQLKQQREAYRILESVGELGPYYVGAVEDQGTLIVYPVRTHGRLPHERAQVVELAPKIQSVLNRATNSFR